MGEVVGGRRESLDAVLRQMAVVEFRLDNIGDDVQARRALQRELIDLERQYEAANSTVGHAVREWVDVAQGGVSRRLSGFGPKSDVRETAQKARSKPHDRLVTRSTLSGHRDRRPAFRRGSYLEEARAVIGHWWDGAAEASDLVKRSRIVSLRGVYHSTINDRDRRAVFAVFTKAFVLGRTRFALGDREGATLAGLSVTTFKDARRRLAAERLWFTYEGTPGRWAKGRRLAGEYHVREDRIPDDPRDSEDEQRR